MAASPGVQNERTALAWQRTALSLLAGSAIVSRLTIERIGPAALLCVLAALPLTVWLLQLSRDRYRRHTADEQSRSRDGRAPLCLAIVTATISLTELLAISRALES
jgi:uncharacterized membrane protein YidH (DUF202 family)